MASKSTQKLCDIVTCPICLETLKNPKMLKCYHFFCNDCLLGTKRNPVNGNFVCSMCRDETAQQHITSVPIMNGLIEAIETAKKNEAPCIMCKTELPEYRCLDCKSLYCPGCKANHDAIPMCAKHRCVRLSDAQAEIYVDELIFCKRHPDKVVELNCVQCNDLVCVLCKAVNHNDHKVETIVDALERLLPMVQTNKETLQKHVRNCESTTNSLMSKSRDIEKHYDTLKQQVDDQAEAAIAKVRADRQRLVAKLDKSKNQDMTNINQSVESMTDKSRSISESITWTDNILATAHSTSLLQELQTGPSKRLLTIEKKIYYPELLATSLFQTDKLEFSPATDERENSIGHIRVNINFVSLCEGSHF